MRKTAQALIEHYSINISPTVINNVTQSIGSEAQQFNTERTPQSKQEELLIVEIDGSMVPIVEYSNATQEQTDRGIKKERNCHWKEFRLCTVRAPDEIGSTYGVTRGTAFEAGCMMYQTCQIKGMTETTHIHGVGDGAPWIEDQYEQQFGANHAFYIDYYHVMDYLSEAAKELPKEAIESGWYATQAEQMKQGKSDEVIFELAMCIEEIEQSSSLQKAYHYLLNRESNLNYPKALAANLPIGSGEVESGHRSVLQSRLKKPGAWWRLENAETMAQIKTLQANEQWAGLWKKLAA